MVSDHLYPLDLGSLHVYTGFQLFQNCFFLLPDARVIFDLYLLHSDRHYILLKYQPILGHFRMQHNALVSSYFYLMSSDLHQINKVFRLNPTRFNVLPNLAEFSLTYHLYLFELHIFKEL